MVDDLPARVPVGRPVEVRMRLTKGDRASREARLIYDYGDGHTEKQIMTRGSDGIYSASLDARATGNANGVLNVRIESGDDSTDQRSIAIVQRLDLSSVQLVITPPAYVNEPSKTVQLDNTPTTVVYGSTLSMTAQFNKPIDPKKSVVLLPAGKDQKPPAVAWDAAAGNAIAGHWTASQSSTFQMQAYDTDGFANSDLTDYQVIVRPDQPPAIQITRPGRNEECTPQAVIPLRAVAEDDFGIKSLKLMATRLGDKPTPLANVDLVVDGKPTADLTWAPLEVTGDIRRWQADYSWDISKLDPAGALKSGRSAT